MMRARCRVIRSTGKTMGQLVFLRFWLFCFLVFLFGGGVAFGAEYFDAPSSDNNFEINIKNSSEPPISVSTVREIMIPTSISLWSFLPTPRPT